VKDELETLRPGLCRLYDRMAVCFHLSYWIGDIVLLYGIPSRFWKRVNRPEHPYYRHRLFVKHGGELSRASKRYLVRRAWRKWVIAIPLIHFAQLLWLFLRGGLAERKHKHELAELCKKANAEIWGIEERLLDARLTTQVAFGNVGVAKTSVGRMTQQGAIGYGGVENYGDEFVVVAKSWNVPLLLHELIKGTAELVCLHGLNQLDAETYHLVTDEADQIEYETSMLQAGAEMWRKFLAVLSPGRPLAEVLMHVARLEPLDLERLMLDVIEHPDAAQRRLATLGED
jgi:hypothetical protein